MPPKLNSEREGRRGRVVPILFAATMIAMCASSAISALGEASGAGSRIFDSLKGVHVAGYQGWFACPDDGAGFGWGHWFAGGGGPTKPNTLAVDEWPDTSELTPEERCSTGLALPSGAPAYLFSNQNPKTVARHFQWMKAYGVDGAAMQRFTAILARPALERHFDNLLLSARAGAEASGRGFFVMYDISGMDGPAILETIRRDWPHLTSDLHITDSRSYIFDRGKPLVGVWGLGFRDRNVSPAEAAAIIGYFKTASVPATVLGGVPASWRTQGSDAAGREPRWRDSRTEPGWSSVYRSFDVISPWTVGRMRSDEEADEFARLRIVPDVAETRRLGIEYMPVVFPGFSFHNTLLTRKSSASLPLDFIPRRCGEFYRHQVDNAVRAGAETLYTAMFDEVNEGTAIFKLAPTEAQQPVGVPLVPMDAGGCKTASSDMYLRLAGEATRALGGRR